MVSAASVVILKPLVELFRRPLKRCLRKRSQAVAANLVNHDPVRMRML
jgi:hypothetical protein